MVTMFLYYFVWWELFKIYSFRNFQVCNTELLTLVTMLDIRSPELLHLTLEVRIFWPTSLKFPELQSLETTSVLCFYEFGILRFSIQVRSYSIDVFLFDISLSIMPLWFIRVVIKGGISFFFSPSFNGSILLQCTYIPHFLYLFTHQQAFRLFPCLGYCEKSSSEHGGTDI